MRYRALSDTRRRDVLEDALAELEADHMMMALLSPDADLTELEGRIADIARQLDALEES
jgi:hypothetical protein